MSPVFDLTEVKKRVLDEMKKHVADLKANPPTEQEVTADPKKFLAKHGIHISGDMEARIKGVLGPRTAGAVQGRGLHIDA
jgi:hypothetical protein